VTSLKVGEVEVLFGARAIAPKPLICDNEKEVIENGASEDEEVEQIDEHITMLEDPLSYEMQQLKELGEQ